MTSCVHLEQVRICVLVISQMKLTLLFQIQAHLKSLKERINIGWQEASPLKLLKLKFTQSNYPQGSVIENNLD